MPSFVLRLLSSVLQPWDMAYHTTLRPFPASRNSKNGLAGTARPTMGGSRSCATAQTNRMGSRHLGGAVAQERDPPGATLPWQVRRQRMRICVPRE